MSGGFSRQQSQSDWSTNGASKRREEVARALVAMFDLNTRREDLMEDHAVEEVILKCEECNRRKVDTTHHVDVIAESKVYQNDKEQRLRDMINDLRNSNLSKAVRLDTLIASNNRKPPEEVVTHDVDELRSICRSLNDRLEEAKEDIVKEELEAERTFYRCKTMLQDKMVMTSKIDEITRNLKFIESVMISQNAISNPRNKQYEEVYAQAELQIEQEAVAKSLILGDLRKQEAIAQEERQEAVDYVNTDQPSSKQCDRMRRFTRSASATQGGQPHARL